MSGVSISGDVSVLFVKVSVVALPTKVSVDVGKVKVPVFDIEDITGEVRVLLVNVCVPVSVTTELSIFKVASPDVAPPDSPVPAITAVISASAAMYVFILDIVNLFVAPLAESIPSTLSLSVILESNEYESILTQGKAFRKTHDSLPEEWLFAAQEPSWKNGENG